MADIKISELTQVSALNNGDLVEVSQVNALAPSGYTSLKASMTDLGKKVNSDIEYTTDLADFTDKTITGAIKETAKGKNVADEYDDTQTYDKGDVVIYKNTLYICTTNNTTGAWDATKWTATTVQSLIGDLSTLTTSDKSSLVGAINEIAAYTPVYGNTASGSIATFDTSLALPLQDCTIDINAVQESGTPTPSSPKAISGFTGANIVNISGEDNDLVTYIRNIYLGTYGFVDLGSLNWTYDAESVPSNPYFFCQRDTVKVSTQNLLCSIYQLANVGVANMPDMSMKSNNKGQVLIVNHNYTDVATFKTAMSGVYLIYELETPTTPTITQAQLTAICTSFNTSGTVYPITWQSEAGTVYGGSLDVTSGLLTITWGYIDLGSINYAVRQYSGNNIGMQSASTISGIKSPADNTKMTNAICEIATANTWNTAMVSGDNSGMFAISGGYLFISTTETVPADFKTAMSGFKLVFELATPVTYQLTPTQTSAIIGTNNIFTDTNGDTSVVYACSLKDYIDGQ